MTQMCVDRYCLHLYHLIPIVFEVEKGISASELWKLRLSSKEEPDVEMKEEPQEEEQPPVAELDEEAPWHAMAGLSGGGSHGIHSQACFAAGAEALVLATACYRHGGTCFQQQLAIVCKLSQALFHNVKLIRCPVWCWYMLIIVTSIVPPPCLTPKTPTRYLCRFHTSHRWRKLHGDSLRMGNRACKQGVHEAGARSCEILS